jgi:hypothetical protein
MHKKGPGIGITTIDDHAIYQRGAGNPNRGTDQHAGLQSVHLQCLIPQDWYSATLIFRNTDISQHWATIRNCRS